MNSKPILFNSEMVTAILNGRKTQTRRVVKSDLSDWFDLESDGSLQIMEIENPNGDIVGILECCPYGLEGDLIWVRETWATSGNYDHIKPSELGGKLQTGDIRYRADGDFGDAYYKWRPSIFMPRWATRIYLKVKNVKIERLQDIDEADAQNEGWNWQGHNMMDRYDPVTMRTATNWFKELWDSINSKRGYSWESNPWVWVVEFERVENTYHNRLA